MASDTPEQGIHTWRAGRAIAGAFGLVFAILYLVEGQSLNFGRMRAPGPGIFPLIVGVIFALVSAGVIADALLTKNAGRATFPKGDDLKRLVVVFVSFAAYAALFNILGFPATTVALVTIFTRVVGNISWPKAALSGAGMTFLMWATFVLLLGVQLPAGIWS